MKRITLVMFAAAIAILFIVASCQEKQKKEMDKQNHVQIMEMMKDSSMTAMMMDQIASDPILRMSMMNKMMSHAKSDTSSMMDMCKTMMEDKDMHMGMMKMMEGGMMKDDGKMMHDMMHGESSDKKMDDTKKSEHEEHHR